MHVSFKQKQIRRPSPPADKYMFKKKILGALLAGRSFLLLPEEKVRIAASKILAWKNKHKENPCVPDEEEKIVGQQIRFRDLLVFVCRSVRGVCRGVLCGVCI